jgi:hypothetical protein
MFDRAPNHEAKQGHLSFGYIWTMSPGNSSTEPRVLLALLRPRGDAQGEAPWPEIVALTGFALATWLCLALSTHFGGWSPSVRWYSGPCDEYSCARGTPKGMAKRFSTTGEHKVANRTS